MPEAEWLRQDVFAELKDVRRRGVTRLEDPSGVKVVTSQLEEAARRVPGYQSSMTRVVAIFLLLEHEIPEVSQPHRDWLKTLFALPEDLRSRDPGALRDALADELEVTRDKFNRKGGMADQAITSLAAQIVADCFTESPDDDDPTEEPTTEPPTRDRRVKRWHIAVGLVVIAAVVMTAVLLLSDPNDPAASAQPDAAQLEARYDGKDPRGLEGKDSQCADPPPSQAVPASTPPVFGPDGTQVGSIELRTSPICPVVWARVLWNSDPNATYQIPAGWTLHVVAHRPDTKTRVDFPEPSSPAPIPYGLGPMLTTARGCVYVEAYFTNGDQKTHAVPTSCVTADASTE